jgi:hypothetical protein
MTGHACSTSHVQQQRSWQFVRISKMSLTSSSAPGKTHIHETTFKAFKVFTPREPDAAQRTNQQHSKSNNRTLVEDLEQKFKSQLDLSAGGSSCNDAGSRT